MTVWLDLTGQTSPARGAVIGGSYTWKTFGCRFDGASVDVGTAGAEVTTAAGMAEAAAARARAETRVLTRGVNILAISV